MKDVNEQSKLLNNEHKRRNKNLERQILQTRYSSLCFLRLYTYSSALDKFLLFLAVLCIILSGASFSFFAINLGNVTSIIISYVQTMNQNSTEMERQEVTHNLDNGVMDFVIINCILAIIIMVCSYVSTLIFNCTALNQSLKMRDLFLRKMLNQDIGWHDVNQTGDFASRIADDLQKIEEGIGEKVSMFLFCMVVFIVSIVQSLVMGWELTLVCLISLPVTALIMTLLAHLSSSLSLKETDAYGAAGAIAEEVFSSIKTVIAFGGEKYEEKRYNELLKFVCHNNIRRTLISGIGEGLVWFVSYCSYALGFWFGVYLIIRDRELPLNRGTYDPGTLIAVFFSIFTATWYFAMSSSFISIFGIAQGAASKIFGIIESKPKINRSKVNGLRYGKIGGKIQFRNVHFSYPSRPNVQILKGLDLIINIGETVALVGISGCGKSTCVQLIQRFYDPTLGKIYIDDYNLEDLDLSWLRRNIGVVCQEPVLFEGTIAQNIKLGYKAATTEDIEEAAKIANAHSFIKNLAFGYNTLVGERGMQLSGGQKQRIAIARALIRKPSILLLDEATSSLDPSSEAAVQDALEIARSNCTTIIVAHRLSTVKKADRIVVLSNGKITEEGTHNILMERKGAYYQLVTSQTMEDLTFEENDNLSLSDQEASESECVKAQSQPPFSTEIVEEQDRSTISIWQILKYNSSEWWIIVIGCICAIVTGASMPVFSILYGKVVGVLSVEDDHNLDSLTSYYAMYFAILGTIIFAATSLQVYCFGFAGEKLTMRLRSKMFHALLTQEAGYFDRKDNGVGALCGLLAGESASVQGATGHRFGIIISSISTVVAAVAVSFYYKWSIALIVFCFAPLIVAAIYLEKRMTSNESRDQYDALQKSAKIAVEAINGIRTVASLGCEDIFHNWYMTAIAPYQKVAQRYTLIRALVYSISRTLILFSYAAAFYYGVSLMKSEGLDYEIIFIISMTVIISSWSLARGFAYTPNFQKGLIAAGRIIQVINRTPLIRDGTNNPLGKWKQTNVKYNEVHFAYPTRIKNKVLQGLNLVVFQGQTVALVGPSGCGKSTVVQLLEKFYDPTYGTISIGERDIDTMNLSALRSQMGMVSQESHLFNRTIADNIAYGDTSRTVSDMEIVQAAKSANIHDFIVSLPLGYDTKLGERGTQLSGGQKQRVAIARVLIRNPRLLLLDEATSSLDIESEKVVQQALDKARLGRTCIMIAHRLSTIQDADVICVINKGKIVEVGTHNELLALKKFYYFLYRLQH